MGLCPTCLGSLLPLPLLPHLTLLPFATVLRSALYVRVIVVPALDGVPLHVPSWVVSITFWT